MEKIIKETYNGSFVEITFSPAFKFVDHLRQFLYIFCSIEVNPDVAHRISFTAHELVENAIKYSCKENTRISLNISADSTKVGLEVSNYALSDRTKVLQEQLNMLIGKSNAELMEIYLEKIASSSVGGTSQLGLTRILFEWQAKLFCNILDTDNENEKEVKMKAIIYNNKEDY